VKALTGIDTDRLEEEKRRGISIELGFACLDLTPDIHLGFVDVPGHERFIRNMLAGVGGIDLVLFVVAADERIRRQTIEHFEICRLLGIQKGIVALTKADLVSVSDLELAQLEIESLVAGSFLEGAPVVPVSATTGEGLPQLRAALERVSGSTRAKDVTHFPRLPIDRVFTVKGQGTVVTGTLLSGLIRLNAELELFPTQARVRVRGLQVHSKPVEQARAGERTAVALGGIEVDQVRRGMTLAAPGVFRVTHHIDCMVELLSSTPPLKHRAPVHFHAGTAEVEAKVRLTSPSLDPAQPGGRYPLRLLLAEPILLVPGDRFIIRRFSPVETIGGGEVVDIATPVRLRRADRDARIRALASAPAVERVSLLVREAVSGMSVGELVSRTGLLPQGIRELVKSGPFLHLAGTHEWVADRLWSEQSLRKMEEALAKFHTLNPLQPGMRKEQLRLELPKGAPAFLFDALLPLDKAIVTEGDLVRLRSFRPAFKEDERKALDAIESTFRQAGLSVPPEKEALARSGINPERARQLLQALLREGKLVRVDMELIFHHTAIDELKRILRQHQGQRFSVVDFKGWTNISRKYAIPLLEFTDRQRMTRREGDLRVIL
jgi:selenocysteine-specific elongation factor